MLMVSPAQQVAPEMLIKSFATLRSPKISSPQ